MEKLAYYLFVSSALALGIGILGYLLPMLAESLAMMRPSPATSPASPVTETRSSAAGSTTYGTIMASIAFAILVLWLIVRTMAAGRGPFSNMHDFSIVFALGIVGVYLETYARYRNRALAIVVLPVALALLIYAWTVPSEIKPLVPALQNGTLLTLHVSVAIIAYSCFTVGFGAGLLYLVQARIRRSFLPSLEVLDEVGFGAVALGFPFMALVLILGAFWANVAWGRYWGWDPKETASLITFLIYATYLHTRALRNWRGQRAAVLLVVGFAAVMLTYFGNYFLSGLHAYK